MRAIRTIHSAFRAIDLFPASQFLRYKGEPEYKTATGGFCSLVIIIIFIVLFINTGLAVLSKATVTVSVDSQHQADPALTTLTVGPQGKFMFAVNVIETGISDATYTYFNVSLQKATESVLGTVGNTTDVPMEPCTLAHFNFNSEIASQFYKYNAAAWLCPPLGHEFSLRGTLVSDSYQHFNILIKKCDSSVHANCVPDASLSSILNRVGAFNAVVATIGTQLNPSFPSDYISYYIEARNIFPFTAAIGVKGTADVQDFEVDTDVSLLPTVSTLVESGAYFPNLFRHYTIPVVNNTFVNINFQKSTTSTTYSRFFQKVDDFLSYVGGLVGLIFSLIFILNSYSQFSFQISLGSHLFTLSTDHPIDSSSFNFLTYLCYLAFKLCRLFGCCTRFQMMEGYLSCHEEVQKQIDILGILQRIATLQRGMITLVQPVGFEMLHFREKPTIEQAKGMREKSYLFRKYAKKDEKKHNQADKNIFFEDRQHTNLFSQHSSVSSMQTDKYHSLKQKFKRIANNEKPSKCINQQFLHKIKIQQQEQKGDKKTQNGQVISGQSYFKELKNPHLPVNNNSAWSSIVKDHP